ncbi:hypothetical protein N9K47_00080 [bacterium]|nr:hypothetical protein [bacterium]
MLLVVGLSIMMNGESEFSYKDIALSVYEKVQEPVHSCLITGRDAAKLLVQEPGQSEPGPVEVPPYHVLLFHGRLVHAGMGYEEERSRLHTMCHEDGDVPERVD